MFSDRDIRVCLLRLTPEQGRLERRYCLLRVKVHTVMTTSTSSQSTKHLQRETEDRGGKQVFLAIQ